MQRESGAPKITAAMIAAGIDAYTALDRDGDSFERIVTDIYTAMADAAKRPQMPEASSGLQ